jgi:hypothetical protein
VRRPEYKCGLNEATAAGEEFAVEESAVREAFDCGDEGRFLDPVASATGARSGTSPPAIALAIRAARKAAA